MSVISLVVLIAERAGMIDLHAAQSKRGSNNRREFLRPIDRKLRPNGISMIKNFTVKNGQ